MTALTVAPDNPGPSAEIYTVTPAVAKRWMKRNVRNRQISQAVVNGYARDMTNGDWQLTGEAVKFDTNNALADGQHRLAAVIQSGAAVQMLIVRGVAPSAQGVMDSGRKRAASDALTLAGAKNAGILAAISRLALRSTAAGLVSPEECITNPTNTEIVDFVDANPGIHVAADMAQHYYPGFDAPPSVLGVCWMRFSEVDLFACGQFFSGVADMHTEGPGDPRLALIRRLANARRNRERLEQDDYLSLIYRAWNAWRRGQSVSKFQTEVRGQAVKAPERLR